jgi:hypothetical protein
MMPEQNKKPDAVRQQALIFKKHRIYSAGEIHSVGQTSAQDPQSVQSSGSIT